MCISCCAETKTGMILMAATRSPAGVIIFSWTAGIMYSTLFTMPYLLVAHYHASQVVRLCNIISDDVVFYFSFIRYSLRPVSFRFFLFFFYPPSS
jgi:hypothetical protein